MVTYSNLTQIQKELFDNLNSIIDNSNCKPLDSFYIEIAKGNTKHRASVIIGEETNVYLFEIENSDDILKLTVPKS
jgi:hypothetical protein